MKINGSAAMPFFKTQTKGVAVGQPRFGEQNKPTDDKAKKIDEFIKSIPTSGNPDEENFLRELAEELLKRNEQAAQETMNQELEKGYGSIKQVVDPDTADQLAQAVEKIVKNPAEVNRVKGFIQEINDLKAGKAVPIPAGADPEIIEYIRDCHKKMSGEVLPLLEELVAKSADFASKPEQLQEWSKRYFSTFDQAAKKHLPE